MARSGGRSSLLVMAVLAAVVLLAAPIPVLAAFAINVQGPSYNETLYDGTGTGGDGLADNIINFNDTIGGAFLTVNTAVSDSPGGPLVSQLFLSWVLTGTGSGEIIVTANAQDYTFPAGSSAVTSNFLNFTGVAGSSVEAQQTIDLGNGGFVPQATNTLTLVGPLVTLSHGPFGPGFFTDTASAGFSSSGLYSITEQVTLTLGGAGSMIGNMESTVVPEPITMFLGGTGVLVLAYAGRRRLFRR